MRLFSAFPVLAMLTACGHGDPPVIVSLLTPTPALVRVGQVTQLAVPIGVNDEDANLTELRVALDGPSEQHAEQVIDVSKQADARNSSITMELQVKPLEAGRYQIEVVAADSDDNVSAPSITTFDAE